VLGYVVAGLIAIGVPALGAIIKLFIDHAVLRSMHMSLQAEVNELKVEVKADTAINLAAIEKRFDKLESLMERFFEYGKRADD